MQIACLGWGSLVWDPRELPIRGIWFEDGPFLPIEYARQSKDGRITLVIVEGRTLVRSLWTLLNCNDLTGAKKALADREGIKEDDIPKDIGFWPSDDKKSGKCTDSIPLWAKSHSLDAVVWTNLPPRFDGINGKIPTVDEILNYFNSSLMPIEKRRLAEEYITKTPPQIDTEYRREMILRLNWITRRTC